MPGSSILFSNWPAIEVGVGLLACNLPTISFQVLLSLPRSIGQGLRLSISGLRSVVARLIPRSRTTHTSRNDGRPVGMTLSHSSNDPIASREQGTADAKSNPSQRSDHESLAEGGDDSFALEDMTSQSKAKREVTTRGREEGYTI